MHVVIVGGGFAGIRAALEMSKRSLGKITLISDHPHFLNRYTLPSIATESDETSSVIQLEDIFAKHHDINVVHDRLLSIDPDRRLAVCKKKRYSYDKLILALGTTTDYSNAPGANKHAFDMETLDHVRKLRAQIYYDITASKKHTERLYTIVGGGSTGVELAGSLASFINQLKLEYPKSKAKIHLGLMEKEARILPTHSKSASRVASKRLKHLGVTILTSHLVHKVGKDTVFVGKHKIPSDTTIWATGTTNSHFYASHSAYFQLDKNGNVMVNPYLEAYRDIYVLGDNANVHFINSAHIATDMGTFIANHFARIVSDRPLRPFRPRTHMISIPIGDDWSYVEFGNIYVSGRIGHILRKRQMLQNYRQIVSKNQALHAWNSYNKHSLK